MNVLGSPQSLLALLTLLTADVPCALAGRILVIPVDGSHWVNMKLLVKDLHQRGHEITVLKTNNSWYIEQESPHYTSLTVNLTQRINTEDPDFFISLLRNMLEIRKASLLTTIKLCWQMLPTLHKTIKQATYLAVEIFENPALMKRLHEAQYDVALIDPGLPAGVLVAHKLALPKVFNAKLITSGEAHFVAAPSPASYVPAPGSALPTRMSFVQRVKNMICYALNACADRFFLGLFYDELIAHYIGSETNYQQLMQSADIWLIRTDFVMDFPRPTMPNIIYIGGFQCKPAEPLPPDLEEFVEGSGEHGLILMSLGTLVSGLPAEITCEIAAGFAQLPQRVIWRYTGDRPHTLGNNTLLVKWFPQNDLLAHPKTRAFVSHGGTNGLYESIYHGVPVVGLPLLFDQFENLLRLEVRGAAKVVAISELDRRSFYAAVQDVLLHPSYRNNMQRLSRLHRDKPAHPRDSATYWLEFVMRHKGAEHLQTRSYKMPWYVYHSVDVVAFLLLVLLTVGGAVILTIRYLCLRLCRTQNSL